MGNHRVGRPVRTRLRKPAANAQAPGLLMAIGFARTEVYAASDESRRGKRQEHFFRRMNEWDLIDFAAKAREKFKDRLKSAHPDTGGTHEATVNLLEVWQKLKRIFRKRGVEL